jgi:hypothetical protein
MTKVLQTLRKHPALKDEREESASVVENYLLAFDFRPPESQEIYRHEQEFTSSYQSNEMEVRRRGWTSMRDNSDRTDPMVLSMLCFEKYVPYSLAFQYASTDINPWADLTGN